MKWKLAIFDLDGTLINTIEDLGNAVNHALESRGLPQHRIEEYKSMVGHGVRNLVWQSMPESCKDDTMLLEELLKLFLDYYSRHIDECSLPYLGMSELLLKIQAHGLQIALASNKYQEGSESLVRKFFPDVRFCSVLGGRKGIPLKPDPAVVNTILETADASRIETVMIGDSATDVSTAVAGGIESIAVTWGFRPREAVLSADYIVESVQELEKLLLG